jgi:hypothetical protein
MQSQKSPLLSPAKITVAVACKKTPRALTTDGISVQKKRVHESMKNLLCRKTCNNCSRAPKKRPMEKRARLGNRDMLAYSDAAKEIQARGFPFFHF